MSKTYESDFLKEEETNETEQSEGAPQNTQEGLIENEELRTHKKIRNFLKNFCKGNTLRAFSRKNGDKIYPIKSKTPKKEREYMNITSGSQKRAVGEARGLSPAATKIKEMPRCLCPSGIAVYSVPTAKIKTFGYPNRKYYSPESITALAQSINKYGVIHPLTVRDMPDGTYELICGERRLRAVRLLGYKNVNCIVISTDRQKSDAMMLCENLQTVEMNYLDIAESIGRLSAKYNLDVCSVAARLCVAEAFVAEKLHLLEWSEGERRKIREAALSERQASSLLNIEDRTLRAKMLDRTVKEHLDDCMTDALVLSCLKKKLKKATPKSSCCLIRDVRIFYNTIERALDVMRRAGYSIGAQKREDDEGSTVITITIPKE